MEIVWTTTPPPRPLRSDIGLIAVQPGESVLARLLGPVWWTSTHWVEPRSVICTGSSCKWHDYPITSKGLVAVEAYNRTWRGPAKGYFLAVLVLTPEVGECASACSIGTTVELRRPAYSANAPLELAPVKDKATRPLPPSFDPRPFALRAMSGQGKKVARLRAVS